MKGLLLLTTTMLASMASVTALAVPKAVVSPETSLAPINFEETTPNPRRLQARQFPQGLRCNWPIPHNPADVANFYGGEATQLINLIDFYPDNQQVCITVTSQAQANQGLCGVVSCVNGIAAFLCSHRYINNAPTTSCATVGQILGNVRRIINDCKPYGRGQIWANSVPINVGVWRPGACRPGDAMLPRL